MPVDTVKRLVPQIIRFGKPLQPGIGVVALSDQWAQQIGVQGVAVQEVEPGSPADRAGLVGLRQERRRRLRLGDVIVFADGKRVRTVDDLFYAFETAGVGNDVTLTVVRDGEERTVRVRSSSSDASRSRAIRAVHGADIASPQRESLSRIFASIPRAMASSASTMVWPIPG